MRTLKQFLQDCTLGLVCVDVGGIQMVTLYVVR